MSLYEDPEELDPEELDPEELDPEELDPEELDPEELDTSWVDNYKINEDKYNDFYNEKVNTIKFFCIYVNSEKMVVNIKQEILTLGIAGVVKREQLISLIKKKQVSNTIKYKLFSIVRYNIDLQPEEIEEFINISGNNYANRFLIAENYINDIYFTDTISIFQDLNSLYIIFKEDGKRKEERKNNNTKKNKYNTKNNKRYTRHKCT